MADSPRLSFWQRLIRPPLVFLVAAVVLVAIIAPIVALRQRAGSATTTLAACPVTTPLVVGNSGNMKPDVIYQIVTDRFFDGDPTNNNPASEPAMYDPQKSNWFYYFGGDFAGIAQKMPYIAGMGVTAIWISPPVENAHFLNYPGYHGYYGRDFYNIDPHWGGWADFDKLVSTAHQQGVKVIIDFAANHSNDRNATDKGAVYKNGVLQAAYNNDPSGWFHHSANIQAYNDQYNVEYGTLADLADFAHENPAVDAYLKGAIQQFLDHHIDGIRMDAVKHMPGPSGGWLRTFDDVVNTTSPHYIIGEWINDNPTSYQQSLRFADQSGMSLLNFPLMFAIDKSIAGDDNNGTVGDFSFKPVDTTLAQQAKDFLWPNDQANFLDNHDRLRFLSLDPSHDKLHEALTVLMTAPGTPIVYYGTEQYLVNKTNGGGDPYNRPMMTQFDPTTPAYRLIGCLAAVRHANPALAYGTYKGLLANKDTLVFERQFGQNTVLVAVNKSEDTAATLDNITVDLPAGQYADALKGIQHGPTIAVGSGGAVASFILPPKGAAVWSYTAPAAPTATIGSVVPELVHPGAPMIIDGQGFGSAGTVQIDGAKFTTTQWSATTISLNAPSIAGGYHKLAVCAPTCSTPYTINTASGPQVPVLFKLTGAPTAFGDQVVLTGSIAELGGGKMTTSAAIPLINAPNDATLFIQAAVPCQPFTYRYAIVHADGSVTSEGAERTIAPACGTTTTVTDAWHS